MKLLSFIFVIIGTLTPLSSKAQRGYIVRDSFNFQMYNQAYLFNKGVFKNNREIEISKDKKSQTIIYYPKEVLEFGFNDGDTYVTKLISEDNSQTPYFLLRLVKGYSNLYQLNATKEQRFFGEINRKMVELKKDSFKFVLRNIFENDTSTMPSNHLDLLKYNQKSLRRFFLLQNLSYKGLFPTFRKGILFGISNTSLEIKDVNGQSISMGSDLSPFIGVFFDFPLGLKPKWSFNFQICYQINSYSVYKKGVGRDLNYLVNTSNISVPILFKYQSTSKKLRAFIQAGPTITSYLQSSNQLIQAIQLGSVIEISRIDLNSISNYQVTGTIGVGVGYSMRPKNSLNLELRYNSGIGLGIKNNHSISLVQLITSVNF